LIVSLEARTLAPAKGSNLRIKLKLSLDEIANGVEKKIKVNRLYGPKGLLSERAPPARAAVRLESSEHDARPNGFYLYVLNLRGAGQMLTSGLPE